MGILTLQCGGAHVNNHLIASSELVENKAGLGRRAFEGIKAVATPSILSLEGAQSFDAGSPLNQLRPAGRAGVLARPEGLETARSIGLS